MSEVIDLRVLSATGDVDDTLLLSRAAAAVKEAGRGAIIFEPGKTYRPWTNGASTVMDLSGTSGVRIIGNNAKIVSSIAAPPVADTSVFIDNQGASDLYVEGLTFVGSNALLTAATGERFIYGGNGSINLTVVNCTLSNCVTGIYYTPGTVANRGVVIENLSCHTVYYPVALYRTSDVKANYTSINAGRSLVGGAPTHNFDVTLSSQHGGPFSDAILGINCTGTDVQENEIANVTLNYTCLGRYVGSGPQNSNEALITLNYQQTAAAAAGHYRNIKINFCVDGTAADPHANIFMVRKYAYPSGFDTTARGHTFREVEITGSANNCQNLSENGIVLFPVLGATMAWTGDFAQTITLRNVQLNGDPPSGSALYVSGQPAVTDTQFVIYDNVQATGELTEANTGGVNIAKRSIQTSNVTAYG